MSKKPPCYRNIGDCVKGDSLRIECRSIGKWKLFQYSGNHKGSRCTVKRNAKATILQSYTNVKIKK